MAIMLGRSLRGLQNQLIFYILSLRISCTLHAASKVLRDVWSRFHSRYVVIQGSTALKVAREEGNGTPGRPGTCLGGRSGLLRAMPGAKAADTALEVAPRDNSGLPGTPGLFLGRPGTPEQDKGKVSSELDAGSRSADRGGLRGAELAARVAFSVTKRWAAAGAARGTPRRTLPGARSRQWRHQREGGRVGGEERRAPPLGGRDRGFGGPGRGGVRRRVGAPAGGFD